jgi:hypothetical protein
MPLSGCDCHGETQRSISLKSLCTRVTCASSSGLVAFRCIGPFRVRTKASIRSARGGREPTPRDDAQPMLGYRGNALVAAAFQLRTAMITRPGQARGARWRVRSSALRRSQRTMHWIAAKRRPRELIAMETRW